MYLCIECNKGFLVKLDFDFHINLHKKDKMFHSKFTQKKNVKVYKANKSAQLNKCMICDEKFDNVNNLKDHSKTAHSGPPFYKCEICKQRFVLKSNYDKHLENHVNVCKKCNCEFQTIEILNSHKCENEDALCNTSTTKSKTKFYGCPFCVSKFLTTDNLKAHLDKEHAGFSFKGYHKPVKVGKVINVKNDEKNSKADSSSSQNGNDIEEQSQLEYLKKYLVPRNGLKLYECFICQKTFYTAQTFKSHLLVHPHLKSMENSSSKYATVFECQQCNEKFDNLQLLRKHIQHHPGKPPFMCKKCKAEYCTLYYLRSHFRKCFLIEFYPCDQCDEIFDLQEQLNDHLMKHSCTLIKSVLVNPSEQNDSIDNVLKDFKIYQCEKCKEKFSNEQHFKCHLYIDCGIKRYECLMCKAHFSTRIDLDNHYSNHNKFIETFSCEECEKVFKSRARFRRHLLIHTGEKPFECDICQKKFYRQPMLISHHLNFHTEKPFQCNICRERFSTEEALSIHLKSHYNNKKQMKCDVCNEEFKTKNEFKIHKQTHVNFKRYECDTCKKKFLTKNKLQTHLIVHLGIKPYQCDICNKIFPIKQRLSVHLLTHARELYLKCEKCQRTFASPLLLKNHQEKCDSKVGQRKHYRCKLCNKVLVCRGSLQHHLLWHAGVKKFKCKECNKAFLNKKNLDRHVVIHDGEKNHECEECGKKFLFKYTLKKHMLIHSDVKPYQCKTCKKTFRHHYSLRNHLVIHAKDREIILKQPDE